MANEGPPQRGRANGGGGLEVRMAMRFPETRLLAVRSLMRGTAGEVVEEEVRD